MRGKSMQKRRKFLSVPRHGNGGGQTNWLFVWTVIAVILAAFICSRWFFQVTLIQGHSMEPTYHNFQFAILDKRAQTYNAGDVLAFRCPGLRATLIKRVAAVPGDTVCISDETLYVNGKRSTIYPNDRFSYAGILAEPVILGDDEYIAIGDNQEESKDSRYESVGVVSQRQIIGKVVIP